MCAWAFTGSGSTSMRILFTASPLVGHVFPMLPLMYAARDAGHEVVMATGAEMVPDLQRRGFTTWTVGPGLGEAVAELTRRAPSRPPVTRSNSAATPSTCSPAPRSVERWT